MSAKKKMIFYFGIAAVVVVVVAGVSLYYSLFRGNPPLMQDQVKIAGAIFNVEVASTTIQKSNGLSFRASLAQNDGMLFLFSSSSVQNFWMKDMNFSLDMIWIGPDATGTGSQVVGFAKDAVPQPGSALWNLTIYSSPENTNKVLEVNAGTVDAYNIKVGDPVYMGQIQ